MALHPCRAVSNVFTAPSGDDACAMSTTTSAWTPPATELALFTCTSSFATPQHCATASSRTGYLLASNGPAPDVSRRDVAGSVAPSMTMTTSTSFFDRVGLLEGLTLGLTDGETLGEADGLVDGLVLGEIVGERCEQTPYPVKMLQNSQQQ